MNKAFVKEDDDIAERLPDRAVSPHPNLVTAKGLALIGQVIGRLKEEQDGAKSAADSHALARIARDLRYWNARQATAQLTEPSPGDTVQFGSTVTFRRVDGRTLSSESLASMRPIPPRGRFLMCLLPRRPFSAGRSGKKLRSEVCAPRSPASARSGASARMRVDLIKAHRGEDLLLGHTDLAGNADTPFD